MHYQKKNLKLVTLKVMLYFEFTIYLTKNRNVFILFWVVLHTILNFLPIKSFAYFMAPDLLSFFFDPFTSIVQEVINCHTSQPHVEQKVGSNLKRSTKIWSLTLFLFKHESHSP